MIEKTDLMPDIDEKALFIIIKTYESEKRLITFAVSKEKAKEMVTNILKYLKNRNKNLADPIKSLHVVEMPFVNGLYNTGMYTGVRWININDINSIPKSLVVVNYSFNHEKSLILCNKDKLNNKVN